MMDVWSHLCLLMVCSTFTWFARDELEDLSVLDEDMSNMTIGFSVLSLPLVPIIIAHMFYQQLSPKVREEKISALKLLKVGIKNLSDASDQEFLDFALAL